MKRIGLAITGSFCTFKNTLTAIDNLISAGFDLTPIFSYSVSNFDTRFFKQKEFEDLIIAKTGKTPIKTIVDAEPIAASNLELMLVAPCTGNTLSKIANGITDTPVTMAVKATLRNNLPVVLSVSSNDALGANAKNLGILSNTRNVYFVPIGQDAPMKKPNSLIANTSLIVATVNSALQGKQIQPVFY